MVLVRPGCPPQAPSQGTRGMGVVSLGSSSQQSVRAVFDQDPPPPPPTPAQGDGCVTAGVRGPSWWGHTFLSQGPCGAPPAVVGVASRGPALSSQVPEGGLSQAGCGGRRSPCCSSLLCLLFIYFLEKESDNFSRGCGHPQPGTGPAARLVSDHLARGWGPRRVSSNLRWPLAGGHKQEGLVLPHLHRPVGARQGWAEVRSP